jgi:hypothetical protein
VTRWPVRDVGELLGEPDDLRRRNGDLRVLDHDRDADRAADRSVVVRQRGGAARPEERRRQEDRTGPDRLGVPAQLDALGRVGGRGADHDRDAPARERDGPLGQPLALGDRHLVALARGADRAQPVGTLLDQVAHQSLEVLLVDAPLGVERRADDRDDAADVAGAHGRVLLGWLEPLMPH